MAASTIILISSGARAGLYSSRCPTCGPSPGKSALAFYLLETYSRRYDLTPAVVGFPEYRRELLPESFIVVDNPDKLTQIENAICFVDEADLQLPIEDTKARKYVINFLSLPRHRNQIFLLAFHFPRLVMGRYLPFFSAFLLKRPPYLIEFAGKRQGDALTKMMERAEERFSELRQDDVVKNTYIVAPRIRWQGMLQNPLCSFWGQELSEVWAGTEIGKGGQIKYNGFMDTENPPERRRWVTAEEVEVRPQAFAILPEYERGVIVAFEVQDPQGDTIRSRTKLIEAIHNEYPAVSISELEDARISYYDYHAVVVLKR